MPRLNLVSLLDELPAVKISISDSPVRDEFRVFYAQISERLREEGGCDVADLAGSGLIGRYALKCQQQFKSETRSFVKRSGSLKISTKLVRSDVLTG
jgi:hypothetical protein